MLKVLVLSRDLRFRGGVVDFIRVLLARMKDGVRADHFLIGKRFEAGNGFPGSLFRPLKDAIRLRRTVLRGGYDLVHLNPSLAAGALFRDGLLSLVLRMAGIPTLVFFHGWKPKTARRVLRFWPLSSLFRLAFGRARALVVLSEHFRDNLVAAGFPEDRVHVLSTMFEGHAFQDEEFRERHLERRTGATVLFFGRFEREKGPYEVISAIAALKRGVPQLKLVMAGEGPEAEGLIRHAEELGVIRDVGFPGFVLGRDRAALMLSCDIFVLPSQMEGCPVVLLEAMGAGCAVVTTPVGGIADVVEAGVNGVILHEVSAESVAKGVSGLLRDAGARERMQAANRAKAFERYETNVVLDKMRNLYQQAAGA